MPSLVRPKNRKKIIMLIEVEMQMYFFKKIEN